MQELILSNCCFRSDGGVMLARALVECHEASVIAGTPLMLKVFIAGCNKFENKGAAAIAKAFKAIQTLEVVAMPQNSVSYKPSSQINHFVLMISHFWQLFALYNLQISHEGIATLSEAFKFNPNMKILKLNDNPITEDGMNHLATALTLMQK